MSIVAPPRPPDTDSPADREALEALIEEARRRARRRRQAGLAALLLAALVAGAFFAFRGGGGRPETAVAAHGAAPVLPQRSVQPRQRANGVLTFTSGPTTSVVAAHGTPRILVQCQAFECDFQDFAWSPDGRTLAYLAGHPVEGRIMGDFSLYAVAADGTHRARLAHCGPCGEYGKYISWSPDGRQIAMAAADGLHVVTVTSPAPPAIGAGHIRGTDRWMSLGRRGGGPVWSPDGSTIAFASADSESLVTVRPDGSGRTNLARVGDVSTIAWSPDAKRLLFDGWGGIYSVRADGSGLHTLVHASASGQPSAPAWSPDGRHIVYRNDIGDSNAATVWIMNSDGHNRRLLYRGGCCVGPYSRPIWSPDGREIAVNGFNPAGMGGIVVMNAHGHVLRTMDSPADAPADLTWQSVAPRH